MEAVHGFRQPTEVDIAIGKKIRKLRQRGKMSLNDLAGKIGISYQQLQKYETGVNRITAGMLVNLSEALGIRSLCFSILLRSLASRQKMWRRKTCASVAAI